jgi:hypothetical protein
MRESLIGVAQFVSDVLDEEDPQHFIKAGDKLGCYYSFVEDIMEELPHSNSEEDVLAIIHGAFVKGFLPAILYQGRKRVVVTEYTVDDYESANRLAGRSELYEGAAKKIWNYVKQEP